MTLFYGFSSPEIKHFDQPTGGTAWLRSRICQKGFSTAPHEVQAGLGPACGAASFEARLIKQPRQPNGFNVSSKAEL